MAKNKFSYTVVKPKRMPFKSKFDFSSDDIKEAISADAENGAPTMPAADVVALTDSDNVQEYINTLEPYQKNIQIALANLRPAKDGWNFFPEPDRETAILIAKSIYQQGQLAPAIVWQQEDGSYMILGGHTRAGIISLLHEIFPDEARFNTLLCHVYAFEQLSEAEARQIILLNNMTQRAKEQPSLLTRSIISMIELEKNIRSRKWGTRNERIAEEVGRKFNISRGKINRIYALRSLLPEFMALYDNGEISENQAYNLAGMKEEVQRYLLVHNQYDQTFSPAQIKALKGSNDCDGILEILTMPRTYSFSGSKVVLHLELPANCKKFSLAVAGDDAEKFKEIVRDAVNNSNDLSEESKKLIAEILGPKN